ncbi:MAG TPA: hypothetical protein VFX63_09900, partial [Pyrinomonadaceae bacterium]|nr:hypothetical protein [Pyrinomonadaceae bacterium]
MHKSEIKFGILIMLLLAAAGLGVRNRSKLEWKELVPIFNENNLTASEPLERHKAITEIEAVDARLYKPIRGATIYLQSQTPVPGWEGLKPRYWLRVEDYETAAMASKRASEYDTVGTYDRIEAAYRGSSFEPNSLMLSKTSVRMWAVARGKRVYALTTDASISTYLEPPKHLKKAIELLP